MSSFQLTNKSISDMLHANKHESMAHKQKKKKSTETLPEEVRMTDLLDKEYNQRTEENHVK